MKIEPQKTVSKLSRAAERMLIPTELEFGHHFDAWMSFELMRIEPQKSLSKFSRGNRIHVDSNWTRVCASENFASTKEVATLCTKSKDMKWCRQWWEHMCHHNDEMTNLKEHNHKLLQNENAFLFNIWTKAQCHSGDKEEEKFFFARTTSADLLAMAITSILKWSKQWVVKDQCDCLH